MTDKDVDLFDVVDDLVTRIAVLEKQLEAVEKAQAAYNQYLVMLKPQPTLPIVAAADSIMGLRYSSHERFIPSYDSEGTY